MDTQMIIHFERLSLDTCILLFSLIAAHKKDPTLSCGKRGLTLPDRTCRDHGYQSRRPDKVSGSGSHYSLNGLVEADSQ